MKFGISIARLTSLLLAVFRTAPAATSNGETLRVDKISYRSGVRKLKIPIVGESMHNEDGIARQFLIEKLKPGHVIKLVRESDNPFDPNAVAVLSRHGRIGYLSREHARQLAPVFDTGGKVKAEVSNIWGGVPGKPHRGVWIWIWDDEAVSEDM